MTKTWYAIPAREGSKGFPEKNKILVPMILDSISNRKKASTIITTDDNDLINLAKKEKIEFLLRDKNLASDHANMKEVMLDLCKKMSLGIDDVVVVLYPTYPERKDEDIDRALSFFCKNDLNSMLCRKKCDHPIPLIIECSGDIHGKPVLEKIHTRRQGWPKYFELCHFISIFKVKELANLNNNLFNDETGWMWIEDKYDIDTKSDWLAYLGSLDE